MDRTGNIAGPLLGYEVLTAFFLEASFLGIMLFGKSRVSNRIHLISYIQALRYLASKPAQSLSLEPGYKRTALKPNTSDPGQYVRNFASNSVERLSISDFIDLTSSI